MARAEFRLILAGLAATSLLGGCVGGTGTDSGTDRAAGTSAPARVAARGGEVEAPDVFQTTDSALWDGRPSLGGIWVASPDVTDPERVVMFNPATGKSVNGALFRRERENPGPTLQLSSDAAEALGILAGQPTEVRVTALRKVEVEAPAEADPATVDPLAADPAAPDAEAADGAAVDPAAAETAALAAAALDAADGTTPAVEGAVVDPAAPVEPPKKKTAKERRAEAKAKREAEKAAKAAAAAGTAPVEGEAVTGAPVDPAASAVAAIETAPLDATVAAPPVEAAPIEAAPVPAAPEKKKTRRQIKAEEEAAAAAAAAAAAEPAPPVAAGRPIQIASFSKEENARRAVDALAKIGIPAQPQQSERSGKAVWGVVAMGDAELLKKIKAAGFADAYFLQ